MMFGFKIISKDEYNELITDKKRIRPLLIQLQTKNVIPYNQEIQDKINEIIKQTPDISNKEILKILEKRTTKYSKDEVQ